MSLLLLFKQGVTGPIFCWTQQSAVFTSWGLNAGDFRHLWSDWRTYTWGQLNSSGYTWSYISGLTFITGSTANTTWVIQSTASQNCP